MGERDEVVLVSEFTSNPARHLWRAYDLNLTLRIRTPAGAEIAVLRGAALERALAARRAQDEPTAS